MKVAEQFQRTHDFPRESLEGLVNMMVDRLHVGQSNRAVLRYVASRIKGGVSGFLRLSKATRRNLMLCALERHTNNRDLYRSVMSGRF